MRTAILLSGQPREVAEVWPTFVENLYNRMPNPDVFIYTSAPYDAPEFFNVVKPRAYVVESQFRHTQIEDFIRSIGFYADHRIDPTIQQFYGVKKAWDLKQQFGQYDFVIRTRPDYIYLKPITLDLIEQDKLNNLHAPWAPTMSTEFAIGPDNLMALYCGMYDWLAGAAQKYLNNTNPRLNYPADHKYNCDVLLVCYIADYLGITIGTPKITGSVYDHYRIMTRHKKGEYL